MLVEELAVECWEITFNSGREAMMNVFLGLCNSRYEVKWEGPVLVKVPERRWRSSNLSRH
jgi:hypothetical protein